MSAELDTLIHTRVMGAVWDETRCRACGWPLAESIDKGCIADNCSMRPAPTKRADFVPPYSTDIAAAWLVVERLYALGFNVSVTADHGWRARWECCVMTPGSDRPFCCDADTPMLAICRAALKAAG